MTAPSEAVGMTRRERRGTGAEGRGNDGRKTRMFAVVKTGGKQYKVAGGDVIRIEKLAAEAGETVEFDQVLMVGGDDLLVGSPRVEGALVRAEVLEQTRGEKVISFKKRRRTHSSQRRRGHRQYITVVRVTEILPSGATRAAAAAADQPAAAEEPATADA
jgi:large subunit ribosomal protein L21